MVLSLTGCGVIDDMLADWGFGEYEHQSDTGEVLTEDQHDYALYLKFHDNDSMKLTPYTIENHLCVTSEDVSCTGYITENANHASGLFDVTGQKVLEAYNCFERLYPASTTKLMTAYLALTMGNLDDEVIVSESALELEPGSQVCGLEAGDKVPLIDLLYGLLLHSGNDAANAIAEHIAGNVPAFVDLMNQKAQELLMSGTHYVNPHGLHDENHYTTAYDLYLIMNECIKIDMFNTIIDTPSYTSQVLHTSGDYEMITWKATNYYFQGLAAPPTNVTVMGGKTGTTDEAGACLVLLSRDWQGNAYISVILGGANKELLYQKMTELLQTIGS